MAEENSIFRKSSLERISSPDSLNEYIKVTNPSLFAIILGIIVVLFSLCVWLFYAEIPKFVSGVEGVVTTEVSNPDVQRLYCYVPISTSKRVSKGMKVQVSPDYAPKEEFGFINGEIAEVGDDIVTGTYLAEKFINPNILAPIFSSAAAQNSNLVELTIDLGEWSNEKGKSITLTDGTLCEAAIVTGNQKALDLIFK